MWTLCHFKCAQGLIDLAWLKVPAGGPLRRDSQILCPGNRAQLDFEGKPRYSQYGEILMDLCRGPVGTTGTIEFKAQSSNDPVEFPLSHSPTTTKLALLLPKDTSGKSKRKLDMSPHGVGTTSFTPLSVSMSSSSGDYLSSGKGDMTSSTIITPHPMNCATGEGNGEYSKVTPEPTTPPVRDSHFHHSQTNLNSSVFRFSVF